MEKLKNDIKLLNHDQIIEIYNILKKTDSKYTTNSNGIFFVTRDLRPEVLKMIRDYVTRASEENAKIRAGDKLITDMKKLM